MEMVSNGAKLPNTKFKMLKLSKKDKNAGAIFEFKSKHLRLYGVADKTGRLILFCGYKNDQEKDILAVIAIVHQIQDLPKKGETT